MAYLLLQGKPEVSKSRLSSILSLDQRIGLMKFGIANMVTMVGLDDLLILAEDASASELGTAFGVRTIVQSDPDVNNSLDQMLERETLHTYGFVTIVSNDLPFLDNIDLLPTMKDTNEVQITPDQHLRGTNMLRLSTRSPFRFHYGVDSFSKHLAEARSRELKLRVLGNPMAFDIDTPEDFELARELFPTSSLWGGTP